MYWNSQNCSETALIFDRGPFRTEVAVDETRAVEVPAVVLVVVVLVVVLAVVLAAVSFIA